MKIEELRASFERWISAPPFEHTCDRCGPESIWPGQYKRYETQRAWEEWRDAIETVFGEIDED